MHPTLCLEEILLNIFGHCHDSSLSRLARTCRTFKEPALDVLWNFLTNLTPLVRCLPKSLWVNLGGVYSFKRHLKGAEWRIILGYTRRVRGLRLVGDSRLTVKCVKELSEPPPLITSIFPRLSDVQLLLHMERFVPFIRHLANPELQNIVLNQPTGTRELRDAVDAFGDRCSNVEEFCFMAQIPRYLADAYVDTISKALCRWTKLTYVSCADVSLTVKALSDLSSRNLRYLSFCPDGVVDCMQSTPSGSPTLSSSSLPELGLSSRSLTSVGRFFDCVSFPNLEVLYLTVYSPPAALDFISFFMALQGACGNRSLQIFTLEVAWPCDDEDESEHEDWDEDEDDSEGEDEDEDEDEIETEGDQAADTSSIMRNSAPLSVTFDCINPLTAFGNIRSITFDTPLVVDLNEQQLLLLASSWSRLEDFSVRNSCESSVITPGGFLQLLERCRLLRRLDIILDTHGYRDIPQGHPWCGLTMPKGTSISLIHSVIEEESVEALGVFFHVAPFPDFRLNTDWDDCCGGLPQAVCDLYSKRWGRVFSLAQNNWEKRRKLRQSLETGLSQKVTQ